MQDKRSWLCFYAQCKRVEHAVKEIHAVCCRKIVEDKHSARLLLSFYTHLDEQQSAAPLSTAIEWCTIYNQRVASVAMKKKLVQTTLTSVSHRPYEDAMMALRSWNKTAKMFYVQVIRDADGQVVLCAVQTAPSNVVLPNVDADDPDDDVVHRSKEIHARPYIVRKGDVDFFPVIFSCDRAPRWPRKQRQADVLYYETLEKLSKNT